ncbi:MULTISPECIES: AAA family ATPase [unclassified Pseudomonas]|uniref:AAA family ATPase n=1 Tax=Pseudomonas sp. 13.2 TaxID=3144665 RepID=A0AAU7BEY9_9PSED|nr:AAA family ATPase [Pseudomonas sp. SWI36]
MFLKEIEYSEYAGTAQEWRLERTTLGQRNLVVGKNSTGKTRTLNLIAAIARSLTSNGPLPLSSHYRIKWMHEEKEYFYELHVEDQQVLLESLEINGHSYLHRTKGGVGHIWADKIGTGQSIEFQTPPSEISIFKRRDSIQHGFLEPIHQWASQVRHYRFGSLFGKDHVTIFVPNGPAVDERDENQVSGLFRQAIKQFGQSYIDAVIADMHKVGYAIESIELGAPVSVRFEGVPGELLSIRVRERGLTCTTDQFGMSQGMYRVLSLFVHLNYMQMKGVSTCVVVDDIGEGLDFERSCQVINVLREKSEISGLQLIMSSNDRFVMNEVPLEEWTVLQRTGSCVRARNYENSAEQFDEFRFTGLSNFSFFEMDYLNESRTE